METTRELALKDKIVPDFSLVGDKDGDNHSTSSFLYDKTVPDFYLIKTPTSTIHLLFIHECLFA